MQAKQLQKKYSLDQPKTEWNRVQKYWEQLLFFFVPQPLI